MDKPTGRQIAAARALAGLSQPELAERSKISVPTLKRMEASDGAAAGMANNVEAVQRALEAAGVIFVPGNGEGRGVRLRKGAETHADLTTRIETMEANLTSVDHRAEPSPAKGMKQLERAHGKTRSRKLGGDAQN